jgi:hypothetical protein
MKCASARPHPRHAHLHSRAHTHIHTHAQPTDATQVWRYLASEELYVDDNVFVFSRGPFVIVMTNVGEAGPGNSTLMTLSGLPKRFHASRLRNIYDNKVNGCGCVCMCLGLDVSVCVCVSVCRGPRMRGTSVGVTPRCLASTHSPAATCTPTTTPTTRQTHAKRTGQDGGRQERRGCV